MSTFLFGLEKRGGGQKLKRRGLLTSKCGTLIPKSSLVEM